MGSVINDKFSQHIESKKRIRMCNFDQQIPCSDVEIRNPIKCSSNCFKRNLKEEMDDATSELDLKNTKKLVAQRDLEIAILISEKHSVELKMSVESAKATAEFKRIALEAEGKQRRIRGEQLVEQAQLKLDATMLENRRYERECMVADRQSYHTVQQFKEEWRSDAEHARHRMEMGTEIARHRMEMESEQARHRMEMEKMQLQLKYSWGLSRGTMQSAIASIGRYVTNLMPTNSVPMLNEQIDSSTYKIMHSQQILQPTPCLPRQEPSCLQKDQHEVSTHIPQSTTK